jgi:DNA-directed RNA polymerase specialized sigma24 family protein
VRNAQRSWRRDQEGRREANLMELAAFENTEALALSEQISLAFTELPDHYQAVLRARYTDQRSVAQIATASQVSFKAMESLLQRAREAFRRAFAKYQGEELPEGSDHGF